MDGRDASSLIPFRRVFLVGLICVAAMGVACHPRGEKRDLSTDPPRVESVDAQFLGDPTKDSKALVHVKMIKGEKLPDVIDLYLEEGLIQLRDDGRGSDREAHDGVYTAITQLDVATLIRNQDRWRKLQKDRRALVMPVFYGRELVQTLRLPKDRFTKFEKNKNYPIERWGFAFGVAPEKSLLIRHTSVVEDPARTFDPCRTDRVGTPMGKWTFGYLMTQVANQSVTHIDPSELVQRWIELSRNNQTVNGWTVFRATQWDNVLDAWPKLPDGHLDLAQAPFKLLAIVNRIDLRDNLIYGGNNAGEARFVFSFHRCVASPRDDSRHPPLTVILEYGIKKSGCRGMKEWAKQWTALGGLSLGSTTYNSALEAITDQFTLAGVSPEKPNGSALNQLRTNGGFSDADWQFREFRLLPADERTTYFSVDTVKQSPDVGIFASNYGNPNALADFVNGNAASILANRHVVPPSYNGLHFLGGSWDGQGVHPGWDSPDISNREARHSFALQTCNGCHLLETGTTGGGLFRRFFHIAPTSAGTEAQLSGFMIGIDVPDPFDNSPTRHFAELDRRAVDLDSLANDPCLSFTDALGRFRERLPHGPIPLRMVH